MKLTCHRILAEMLAVLGSADLAIAQTVDPFKPEATGGYVESLAVQPDGNILLGGTFGTIGGRPRYRLGRVTGAGALDESYAPDPGGLAVNCMAVLPDCRTLVGGHFSVIGGRLLYNVGLLQVDGTADPSFSSLSSSGLNCLLVQPDGKILIGQGSGFVGRFNPDGTRDGSFRSASFTGVNCLALQSDGRILVGGDFGIARLSPEGTRDTGFNPTVSGQPTTSWGKGVITMLVRSDDKILVGGNFYTLGGRNHQGLGLLSAEGALETNFTATVDSAVHSLALQADGKILVAGSFNRLAGGGRVHIGRLNPNGSLDTNFVAGVGGGYYVLAVALQPNGDILLGGDFTQVGVKSPYQSRRGIGRLVNTDPATESLGFNGTTITWLRGGTAPEVWHCKFDYTPDGGRTWANLGAGVRIAGGWELTGVSVPAGATLRACGFASGGHYNASGTVIESSLGPPALISQPLDRTNLALTTATFSLLALGNSAFSYQWFKDSQPLENGPTTVGAQAATLILSNVLGTDRGFYWATASNNDGVATSRVATLSVVDPRITLQPRGLLVSVGQSASFQVDAVGTTPIAFQWQHDGVPVPGKTTATLVLTNVQTADAGDYRVVASSSAGATTSMVAALSVNEAVADALNPGADGPIYCLAVQTDGKILLGGPFSTVDGQPRTGLARLNPAGTLDTSFSAVFTAEHPGYVHNMAVQEDGRIIVAGSFESIGGVSRTNLARLHPTGSVDHSFNASSDGAIDCLALQPDGRILVSGSFTIGGQPRGRLARLNPDGTADENFHPALDGPVNNLAVLPDGRILLAGRFSTIDGVPRAFLGRLEASGALDTGFDAHLDSPTVIGVGCLALQADGRILVHLTRLAPGSADLVRLHPDGSLDSTFGTTMDVAWGSSSMVVQADGKILLGGDFNTVGGKTRHGLARLLANGVLEPHFIPGFESIQVYGLALQADGNILVGGGFGALAGEPRSNLARLSNSPPITETFSFDGARLTWLRLGAGPEFAWTTFAYSTNGADWVSLGGGVRVPGGWQLTTGPLPSTATLRARGLVSGGYFNGSCWFVERNLPMSQTTPGILTGPDSLGFQAGQFGFNIGGIAGQTVVTEGSTNLVDWLPLGTNTLGSSPSLFRDSDSANLPSRFYRLRLQ